MVRQFRIHPEWQNFFNMLRVRRGTIEDATTSQADTTFASQNNEVVAIIRHQHFHELVIDIDEEASTDGYWKLAPTMFVKLREFGDDLADFDIGTEGFIVKRYCQPGSPLLNSLEALVDGVSSDTIADNPAYWAISLEQLNELAEAASTALGADYEDASMHDVVERVIKPATAAQEKSYALVKNAHVPLLLTVFISHCWRERFGEFVECINATFRSWLTKPQLWICATALFQTDDAAVIAQQVGTDPSNAPFTQALRHASLMLVVRNAQVDLYSRIWCIWELFLAERLGITARPGGMQVAGPDAFQNEERVDITQCHASDEGDKHRILDYVWDMREKVNTIATLVKKFT